MLSSFLSKSQNMVMNPKSLYWEMSWFCNSRSPFCISLTSSSIESFFLLKLNKRLNKWFHLIFSLSYFDNNSEFPIFSPRKNCETKNSHKYGFHMSIQKDNWPVHLYNSYHMTFYEGYYIKTLHFVT